MDYKKEVSGTKLFLRRVECNPSVFSIKLRFENIDIFFLSYDFERVSVIERIFFLISYDIYEMISRYFRRIFRSETS